MTSAAPHLLVVGSGASGVQAAEKLLDLGCRVTMLDVGNRRSDVGEDLPKTDYVSLRQSDPEQWRYFLGESFQGLPLGDIRSGNKLGPLRSYVLERAADLVPIQSDEFVLNHSVAMGGLAQSWGAGAMPLRPEDMQGWPIGLDDLEPAYEEVARSIGVSGADDDLADIVPALPGLQPPLEIDDAAACVLERYSRRRERFRRNGLTVGRAWLAVLSEPLGDRERCEYRDLEFWGDPDRSVYRPRWTLDTLRRRAGFEYRDECHVRSFTESREERGGVRVALKDLRSGLNDSVVADGLLLAAGVPGSACIALDSLGPDGSGASPLRLPIRTNAYCYIPCFNYAALGKPQKDRRSGLAQLSFVFQPEPDPRSLSFSSFFTYRSLMIFRLLREGPIPIRDGLNIFPRLLPYLSVVTVIHGDYDTGTKEMWLERDARKTVHIRYQEDEATDLARHRRESSLMAQLRRLGLLPLKRIRRQAGSSIHYSSTLPMRDGDDALTCGADGRLRPWTRVWVADGSALPEMPAILPTLTFMANARRVAGIAASELKAPGAPLLHRRASAASALSKSPEPASASAEAQPATLFSQLEETASCAE